MTVRTHRGSGGPAAVLLTADGEEAYSFGLVEEESAEWEIKKPSKPVEAGYKVTDHALLELDKLTLQVALDTPEELALLRRLMTSFTVVDVVARLRVHPSMMITSVKPTMGISDAIEVNVSFEEYREVATRLVQMPTGSTTGRGGRGQANADADVVEVTAAAAGAAGAALADEGSGDVGQTGASAVAGAAATGGGGVDAVAPGPTGSTGTFNDHERTWPQEG